MFRGIKYIYFVIITNISDFFVLAGELHHETYFSNLTLFSPVFSGLCSSGKNRKYYFIIIAT